MGIVELSMNNLRNLMDLRKASSVTRQNGFINGKWQVHKDHYGLYREKTLLYYKSNILSAVNENALLKKGTRRLRPNFKLSRG